MIYDGSRVTQTVEHHDLWRVALGTSRYECTLMSGFEARLLDSRVGRLLEYDVINADTNSRLTPHLSLSSP